MYSDPGQPLLSSCPPFDLVLYHMTKVSKSKLLKHWPIMHGRVLWAVGTTWQCTVRLSPSHLMCLLPPKGPLTLLSPTYLCLWKKSSLLSWVVKFLPPSRTSHSTKKSSGLDRDRGECPAHALRGHSLAPASDPQVLWWKLYFPMERILPLQNKNISPIVLHK